MEKYEGFEIDREALANELERIATDYYLSERLASKSAIDDFISTMPTWLKPTERK